MTEIRGNQHKYRSDKIGMYKKIKILLDNYDFNNGSVMEFRMKYSIGKKLYYQTLDYYNLNPTDVSKVSIPRNKLGQVCTLIDEIDLDMFISKIDLKNKKKHIKNGNNKQVQPDNIPLDENGFRKYFKEF